MSQVNTLRFPSLDRSLNFKEQMLRGWNAVEAAIYVLISTPMNSIPEMPSMGFDLHEFLFRDSSDGELSALENELSEKIRQVTNNSNIECTVEVEGSTAYITVIYQKDDGSEERLPISIEEGTGGRFIKFKNIIVR